MNLLVQSRPYLPKSTGRAYHGAHVNGVRQWRHANVQVFQPCAYRTLPLRYKKTEPPAAKEFLRIRSG